jgi:predicted nucleotidyltransferase
MNCGTMFEKPSKPISSTARRRNLSDFTSYVTNRLGADKTVKRVSGLGTGDLQAFILTACDDRGRSEIVNRSQVLQLLAQSTPALAERFGLVSLALFGSMARDAANLHSDIDILVCFNAPATSDRFFGVQFFVEDLLGRPVDLVTDKALRPELRPFIEREAVYA